MERVQAAASTSQQTKRIKAVPVITTGTASGMFEPYKWLGGRLLFILARH